MEFSQICELKSFEKLPGILTVCCCIQKDIFYLTLQFKVSLFCHKDWTLYVLVYNSGQKCGAPLIAVCFILR